MNMQSFMFDTPLTIKTKEGQETSPVYSMLLPIKKSKYPAITEEEEAVSLPLQTMCGAIFDAILVHMMNTVSEPDVWQPLKRTMVENLNKKKVPHTLEILSSVYSNSDIITIALHNPFESQPHRLRLSRSTYSYASIHNQTSPMKVFCERATA